MPCKEEDAFYFVSSEGIGTAILTQILQSVFSVKHMWTKWNKNVIFFPVIGFRYLNINGFKRLQPLTLEWLYRPAVPKLGCDPNLSLANIPRLSSFLIPAIYSFLEYMQYKQTPTSSGNVENMQLRFGPLGRDPFWPFASRVWISTPTLGTTSLD